MVFWLIGSTTDMQTNPSYWLHHALRDRFFEEEFGSDPPKSFYDIGEPDEFW
eukprot:gene53053-2885_t